MKPMRKLSTAMLLLLLLLPSLGLTADSVRFMSLAEVEVQQLNPQGEKVWVRQPASLLEPGQIAIYTNRFTNHGKQPVEKVVINNPVPDNTEYLGGSATETGYDLVFSVDQGKSFGKPQQLTLPDGKGGQRLAEPKEYTHIRWTMQTPLQPGATGVVEFRVRVK